MDFQLQDWWNAQQHETVLGLVLTAVNSCHWAFHFDAYANVNAKACLAFWHDAGLAALPVEPAIGQDHHDCTLKIVHMCHLLLNIANDARNQRACCAPAATGASLSE